MSVKLYPIYRSIRLKSINPLPPLSKVKITTAVARGLAVPRERRLRLQVQLERGRSG